MRGGFVACWGGDPGLLERLVDELRWHRGVPFYYHDRVLHIAGLADSVEGPFVETGAGLTRLVHGSPPQPAAKLQRSRARFAALEWNDRHLWACRDRLGQAPLFYRIYGESLWLASEIHPLLALGGVAPDLEAISARAAFAPIEEETGWSGVRRVLPGSALEIASDLRIDTSRYWLPDQLIGTYRGSRDEAVVQFRELFQAAVDKCFEPGSAVLLSGGQDSAAISVVAGASGRGRPYLVHAHFSNLPETHEQRYAGTVAEAVGVPLETIPGEARPWDIDAIDSELESYGIPYDWAPLGLDEPMFRHLGGQGITVALDGHDADGYFGVPATVAGVWGTLLLGGQFGQLRTLCGKYGFGHALRRIASDLVPRPAQLSRPSYVQWVASYFHEPLHSRMIREDVTCWRWPSKLWRMVQLRPLGSISFEPKEIDAARFGVDLRHPFADPQLVDFLISLPCGLKTDPECPKSLMLDALGDLLPPSISERRKGSPANVIARHRVAPARCLEIIRASKVRLPHVDYERLWREGNSDPDKMPIWMLINLARFHRFAQQAAGANR